MASNAPPPVAPGMGPPGPMNRPNMPPQRPPMGRPPPNGAPRRPDNSRPTYRPPPSRDGPPGRRPPPSSRNGPPRPIDTSRGPPLRQSSRSPGLQPSKSDRRPRGPPKQQMLPPPRKQSLSSHNSPRLVSSAEPSPLPSPLPPASPNPPRGSSMSPALSGVNVPYRSNTGQSTPSTPGFPQTPLSTSAPDSAQITQRSAAAPSPQRSFSARNASLMSMQSNPSLRHDPMPATRESVRSAMTTGSAPPDIAGPPGGKTDSMVDSVTGLRVPDVPKLQKSASAEDITVDEYINMYTDEFHMDSARSSNADVHRGSMPGLSELRKENETLPAPRLPALSMLESPAGLTTALATGTLSRPLPAPDLDRARTSAEIIAGKYDVAPIPIPNQLSKMTSSIPRDRYGFKKENQFISTSQYDSWNAYYTKYIERRRTKWNELMTQFNLPLEEPTHFPPKSEKLKRYVRKGIPPEWRGAAWFYYAGGPAKMASTPGLYNSLAVKADMGDLADGDREHIERDLHRTFPDNLLFKPDFQGGVPRDSKLSSVPPLAPGSNNPTDQETPMITSLRRVLRAFAIQNPKIGYCQSLNFLAGQALLFLNGDEEKAFYLLYILCQDHLPGTHGMALEGANVDIGVLMSSLRDTLPIMWAKMDDRQDISAEVRKGDMRLATGLPTVSLATTAWFMSCFVGTLPVETACRVWDVLFYEGSKTLFRVALGIFKLGERDIMRLADPMEVFQLVQTFPRRLLDANALMEASYGRRMDGRGLLSQEVVEKRRTERRQMYQNERERFQNGSALAKTQSRGQSGDSGDERGLRRAKSSLKRFKSRKRGMS